MASKPKIVEDKVEKKVKQHSALKTFILVVLMGGACFFVGAYYQDIFETFSVAPVKESEKKEETKKEEVESKYEFIEKKNIDLKGKELFERLMFYNSTGASGVSRKNFFENKDYMLEFVADYYIDGQDENYGFTKKKNLIENVKEVFGVDYSEKINEVISYTFVNGYNYIDMSCIDENCYFFAGAGGEATSPDYVNTLVNEEVVGENTVYTVKEFWMDYPTEEGTDIYTERDGELLIKKSKISTYEDLVKVISADQLNTYKFIFDKDGNFVSFEEVK